MLGRTTNSGASSKEQYGRNQNDRAAKDVADGSEKWHCHSISKQVGCGHPEALRCCAAQVVNNGLDIIF
jgi:hypothetical protein